MNWFIISIIPPMIWAATNHIDKYLLNRFFKNSSGGALVIMSALASILPVVLIAALVPDKIWIGLLPAIITFGLGIIFVVTSFLYLKALSKDEPSVVVPMFQLITVFNYVLGLIFLNEHLTTMQIAACLLVIIGAVAITLDLTKGKFRLKKGVFLIMLLDCAIISAYDLIFKKYALATNFWGAMFWPYLCFFIAGILLLLFYKKWKKEFWAIFAGNKIPLIGLNLFNEVVNIIAGFIFNYALLIMPMAIISVVGNGLQPFFVFVFGIVLTIFMPHFGKETISKQHLFQRIMAILIIFIGSYLLNK